MRVLHLTSGNLYGGIETFLVTLAHGRALCPEVEPEFALCFEGRLQSELTAAGAPVHVLGGVRFSRPWTVWLARRRLAALLARAPVDCAVTHGCWPHALFAPVLRRRGVPVVYVAHGLARPEHWLDRKASLTSPDTVLVNSRHVAASVRTLFPDAPAEVVHYPVAARTGSAARRSEIRAAAGTADDAVVILMASRMEEWKGHPLLLEALGGMADHPGWTCWIAGGAQSLAEQAYVDRLMGMADRLGIKARLRWLGQRGDVPDLMAAADIFCQPNLGPEPFGIVFIEALYAGRPVVSVRHGGAAEIVDDSCGLLTEPGDREGLTRALRRMVDDGDLRERLGAGAPARASELCDQRRQMRAIFDLFRRTVRRKKGGAK